MKKTAALILAAGQGTRMKSAKPKVLHAVCGRPLLHYPVRAALEAGCDEVIVVVGHGGAEVTAYLGEAFGKRVKTAVQKEQKGTGDAASAGLAAVSADVDRLLIFYGDVPLLTSEDLRVVMSDASAPLALAVCTLENPFGYGRILRGSSGTIVGIREQKDLATDEERKISEINPGIYFGERALIHEALLSLTPNNAQGEYYLTDIIGYAVSKDRPVLGQAARQEVMIGVNDRFQLAEAEDSMQERILERHRKAGVTIRRGVSIEDGVVIGRDTILESQVVLRGATTIGEGVRIDVGSVLTDVIVGNGATIKPYSVAEKSVVGQKAQVGPFSHLRPDTDLGDEVHIGNFVETKKTKMARGAKANHLAYLGDGVIGERVNVGAGTIFCNYDGFKKHTTTIEDGAFIGSDTHLIAPVTIGKNSYVATGTTVTKNVPEGALAISRVKQENKEGYADRLRARLKG